MSFVDELRRRPAPQNKDAEYLRLCCAGIQYECRYAREKRILKGYIYRFNDDGYGDEARVAPCLPRKSTAKELKAALRYYLPSSPLSSLYCVGGHRYLWEVSNQFEPMLRQELIKMGFTNFALRVNDIEDESVIVESGLFGRTGRYEKNGRKGKSIYIELNW